MYILFGVSTDFTINLDDVASSEPRVFLLTFWNQWRDSTTYSGADRARLALEAVRQVVSLPNWEDDYVLLFLIASALKEVVGAFLNERKENRRSQGEDLAHASERPLPGSAHIANSVALTLLDHVQQHCGDPLLVLFSAPDRMRAAHRSAWTDEEGRRLAKGVFDEFDDSYFKPTWRTTFREALFSARVWRSYHQLRIGYHGRHGEAVPTKQVYDLVKKAKYWISVLDLVSHPVLASAISHERANLYDFITQIKYPSKDVGSSYRGSFVDAFYNLNFLEPERFSVPRKSDSSAVTSFGKRLRPLLIAFQYCSEIDDVTFPLPIKAFVVRMKTMLTVLGEWNNRDCTQPSSHSPVGPSSLPPSGGDFTASSQPSSSTSRKAERAKLYD